MNTILDYLIMLVPMFRKDVVVGELKNNRMFYPICSIEDVDEDEVFTAMVEVHIFTWFNWCYPIGKGLLKEYNYEKGINWLKS